MDQALNSPSDRKKVQKIPESFLIEINLLPLQSPLIVKVIK